MDFLTYLGKYEKENINTVKQIVKENESKFNAVIKEAFYGDFVGKHEALSRISTEYIDTKLAPKSIDVNYVKENLSAILQKVNSLDEGTIKIIINTGNTGEHKCGCLNKPIIVPDIEFEEGCNKSNKKPVDEKSVLKGKRKKYPRDYYYESMKKKLNKKNVELEEIKNIEDVSNVTDDVSIDNSSNITWSDIEKHLSDIDDKLTILVGNEDDIIDGDNEDEIVSDEDEEDEIVSDEDEEDEIVSDDDDTNNDGENNTEDNEIKKRK